MKFEVKGSLMPIVSGLDMMGKQERFATARALTEVVSRARDSNRRALTAAFDRPTPYTLNSLYITPATPSRLQASVWLKEDTGKGTPAWKYLGPQIEGGERRVKRMESALRRVGVMYADQYVAPGAACPRDQYGNIPASFVTHLLAYFQAMGEQGYKGNMTLRKREALAKDKRGSKGFAYFALRARRNNLAPGIYRRITFAHGSAVQPVLMFVRKPSYRQRWDFYGIAEREAQQFPEIHARMYREALASAR